MDVADHSEFTDLQPVTKFQAHDTYITRCALSPDARYLATCSADKTVKIWSTDKYEFQLDKVLVGHQRWVWDVAFSADSAYLVTGTYYYLFPYHSILRSRCPSMGVVKR